MDKAAQEVGKAQSNLTAAVNADPGTREAQSNLNEANTHLESAANQLDQAVNAQAQAQSEQAAAQKEQAAAQQTVDTTAQDVAAQQTVVDGLQQQVDATDMNTLLTDAAAKKQTSDQAQAQADKAAATAAGKNTEADRKQQAVKQAEQLAGDAKDPVKVDAAKTDMDAKQAAADHAATTAKEAADRNTQAQGQLAQAQADAESARKNLTEATTAQEQAKTAADAANRTLAEAKQAADQTANDAHVKAEAKKAADANVQAAQSAADEAQAKLDAAVKAQRDAQARLDAANAMLKTVEPDGLKAEQQEKLGALGWFQQRGDKMAQETLTNPNAYYMDGVLDYTHIGAEGDATSLPNLIAGIKMVQETNRLRATMGWAPLRISDFAMAQAMVNANYATVLLGHSENFESNENLSWGYADPYDGWWTAEKKIFDDAVASGDYPGLENMDLYDIYWQYPKLWDKAGHYLNLRDTCVRATGAAITQVKRDLPYACLLYTSDAADEY